MVAFSYIYILVGYGLIAVLLVDSNEILPKTFTVSELASQPITGRDTLIHIIIIVSGHALAKTRLFFFFFFFS